MQTLNKPNDQSGHTISQGFYYHFKHDKEGVINNYAYEVIGIGKDTETESLSVIYRPLYINKYIGEAGYFIRPIDMFNGTVDRDDKTVPRFRKIEDQDVIDNLIEIKKRMYGEAE